MFNKDDNGNPCQSIEENLLRQIIGDNCGGRDYSRSPDTVCKDRNVGDSCGNRLNCSCKLTDNVGSRGKAYNDHCGRNVPEAYRRTWGLCDYPLGMVYTPIQEWRGLYDLNTGFDRGTIFRELYKPWIGSERTRGGCCRG